MQRRFLLLHGIGIVGLQPQRMIYLNYFPALQPPSIIMVLPVTIALSPAAR